MAKTTTALGILTTAAAGAALMYLFDPEKGEERRDKLTGIAGNALEAAGSYAGDTWGSMSEKLHDLAGDLQDRASDFASDHDTGHLKDQISKLASYATALGSKLSDRASSWRDSASDMADDVSGRVGNLRDRAGNISEKGASYFQRERHGVGTAAAIGAGGIGMLAIGAGLVYFLDPDHGEERRNSAINLANKTVGDIGDFAGKCGNYLRDQFSGVSSAAEDVYGNVSERASGMMKNVQGRFSGGENQGTQDTTLIDQVRSQLSDMFPAARGLQIDCSNGKLTLSGTVPASDYDRIVETARAIPGVNEFDNQLQTAGA